MQHLNQQVPPLIFQRRGPRLAHRRSLERVTPRTQPEERLSSIRLVQLVEIMMVLPYYLLWTQKTTAYMRVIRTVGTFHMVSKAKEVMFGAPTITRMKSRIHHINSNRGRHFPRSKKARQRPCLESQILILCAPCLVANAPSVVSRVSNPASALSEHPLTIRRTSTGPSAASSVTVKVEEGGEDDIPVSIRNSFRELRSVKEELECQRSENERLRVDLAASQKTAADTLTRLDNVKQMTKKSIKTTSNELAELHAGLVSLKAQSNESFAFAAQARSALPDISDLRSWQKRKRLFATSNRIA
ncbi:hypothetical protein EDB83DRAFT_1699515 [Lactarius deliciosus]|nr:hypothetical protein EDB83DRAFT_1699515 [Lactarius deliciosus]